MLTDTKIKSLKPKEKLYKVADRDGLYVAVLTSGAIVFRYDYRINGRRETLTIGKYREDEIINLGETNERLVIDSKRGSETILQVVVVYKNTNCKKFRNLLVTSSFAYQGLHTFEVKV